MKKVWSFILILAVIFSLCACGDNGGSGETKAPEGLQVGYARESIMPEGQVNISGAGNQQHRISVGFLDYLYATCIAVSENGNTVLLYSVDALSSNKVWTEEARKLINEATGVPVTNIHIAATHTHSGPAVGGSLPLILQWKPIYMDALVNSAKAALADQAPTTLYGQKVETEKMTFVRHYEMADGSYAGSNFGDSSKGTVRHATDADEQMVLIKMDREGDKKDIMLMNFQAHPCYSGAETYLSLSADFIGSTREVFEKSTNMHFIYFAGSTGNQSTNSWIKSEEGPHNADRTLYGIAIAQYAIDAIPQMTTPIEGAGLKTSQKVIDYKCNDYGQDRLEEAKKVSELFYQTGDASACTTMAKGLGFHSVYECNGIVNCSKYPPTDEIELNVCSFGGIGFVAAPYEMFSNSGMYIKENSPFEYTVVSTTTNAYNNYFPTKEAFVYGCYESFTAKFASGVAEDVAAEFVDMLKAVQ